MTSPFDDVPSIRALESRFSFIDAEITKQNVTVCFQYIIFLTVTQTLYKNGGSIALSINRDIVVHTASVVEACLHYGIKEIIRKDPEIEKKLQKKWKRVATGYVHTFKDPEHNIIWQRQKKIPHLYSDNPKSEDINKAAFDIELIDDKLFGKAENIRKARNHIHFVEEDRQARYPSSDAVNSYFDDSKILLDRIKLVLSQSS